MSKVTVIVPTRQIEEGKGREKRNFQHYQYGVNLVNVLSSTAHVSTASTAAASIAFSSSNTCMSPLKYRQDEKKAVCSISKRRFVCALGLFGTCAKMVNFNLSSQYQSRFNLTNKIMTNVQAGLTNFLPVLSISPCKQSTRNNWQSYSRGPLGVYQTSSFNSTTQLAFSSSK